MPVGVEAKPVARGVVDPVINSVVSPSIKCNGDLTSGTDQPIIAIRVVINPGDKRTAANKLAAGTGCLVVMPGDSGLSIQSPQMPITAVALIAVGGAAAPASLDYTGGQCIISEADNSATTALAQMAYFEFLGSEVVRAVDVITTSTYAAGLAVRVKVLGYDYGA